MNKDIPFSTIMVELDALLDTRIACLSHLSNEQIKEIMDKGYHTRLIDEFPYVSFNSFKKIYSQRSKSVLQDAIITPVVYLVKEFAIKKLKQISNSPFHEKPRIIINTHPYVLNDEEIISLAECLITVTEGYSDVQFVNLSKEELTVGYVKNNISILVMYESYEWLEYHGKIGAFPKITCPEVTLFAPAIYFKPRTPLKEGEDPFKAMELITAPLIGLKLLPIELFSLVIKPVKT